MSEAVKAAETHSEPVLRQRSSAGWLHCHGPIGGGDGDRRGSIS